MTHDQARLTCQRLRARPGSGQAVLHGAAWLRGAKRLDPRRLSVAHGRSEGATGPRNPSRLSRASDVQRRGRPDVAGARRQGALGGGVIETDDCRATYAELVEKGVTFLQEPADRPYGVEALFRDDSGNWFSLTQSKLFQAQLSPAPS